MAQQDITDVILGPLKKVIGKGVQANQPSGKYQADPGMVKEANESFMPKPVAKKPVAKPVKKRTAPLSEKRSGRKRY